MTAALILFTIFLLVLFAQGLFSNYVTLYVWQSEEAMKANRPPRRFLRPKYSFSVFLPVYHEEEVIKETIKKVARAQYPKHMVEILVLCRANDTGTIAAARQSIEENRITNARVLILEDGPPGKPAQLNMGLAEATNDITVIFDAEDDVSPEIFSISDTLFQQRKVDILQGGVQLMDYASKWFSVHNVLEYYFWFKSRMHFHARVGMVPLGGNTVFFKTQLIRDVGGWDELCLTEDAEIGLRMSAQGAKVGVFYSSEHVTKEETPDTTEAFIKQRTRWIQGFLQVFKLPAWRTLPKKYQIALALYVLGMPVLQAVLILLTPVFVWISIGTKLPVVISMISFLPLTQLLLLLAIQMLALHEFGREQKQRIPIWVYGGLLLTFMPYQLALGYSAIRAIWRELTGAQNWEKTLHRGAHRQPTSPELEPAQSTVAVAQEGVQA